MRIAEELKKTGCTVRENAPMKEYTTFRVGGNADLLVLPETEEQLQNAYRLCLSHGIKPFVFGNGSNLLVSDDGLNGVVFRLGSNYARIELLNETEIYCTSGTKLSDLCLFAEEHSLTGLEFAYGIPGCAGGAAFMNGGAYGGEMKDVLVSCSHLDENGNFGTFVGEELKLSYRHSIYSENGYLITGMNLRLQKGKKEEIHAQMRELLQRRVDKQPLDLPSAGSYFKRPVGNFAGALIEQCGLKGLRVGDAEVSEKHAGFLVNRGHATTADILKLEETVRQTVLKKTGVCLEREVQFIGRK
ncbi:MAG TPA: UDP-N-acetylenolpyruvoylglucosamine reductase [Ruminococcaceae bacterium]|nr:UDP-N-acetylenolpyruvoylglucosamine reductase [Oscillospiraceae bacterium]